MLKNTKPLVYGGNEVRWNQIRPLKDDLRYIFRLKSLRFYMPAGAGDISGPRFVRLGG